MLIHESIDRLGQTYLGERIIARVRHLPKVPEANVVWDYRMVQPNVLGAKGNRHSEAATISDRTVVARPVELDLRHI
ncbi:hypothetical protein ACFQAT_12340 [Undibacterium arcticum]|uniref:Transposase n=1 Tax=Undibacterium arcticum TaxID=1762892 RepID=A0ABV7F6A2_9BURK